MFPPFVSINSNLTLCVCVYNVRVLFNVLAFDVLCDFPTTYMKDHICPASMPFFAFSVKVHISEPDVRNDTAKAS